MNGRTLPQSTEGKQEMTEARSITLYCREGTSDKEYQLHLVASGDAFVVNYANGRRGKPLKSGTKTQSPVSYDEASKLYDKVVKSKLSDGYTQAESGRRYAGTDLESRDSGLTPQLPTAILPDDVAGYEADDLWIGQEKHDGENRVLAIQAGTMTGSNRRGLTCPVPADWDSFLLTVSPARTVLYGEDMGDRFVAFDATEVEGVDISRLGYLGRHAALAALVERAGRPGWIEVSSVAIGTAAKKALLARMATEKREGVVYKRGDAPFSTGRTRDAVKHKLQESSTFEVVKVNAQRSVAIALRDADGAQVPMGSVTVPANHDVPAVDDLVEVQYMYRYEDGALEQPKYKGARTDLDAPTALADITRVKRKSPAAA